MAHTSSYPFFDVSYNPWEPELLVTSNQNVGVSLMGTIHVLRKHLGGALYVEMDFMRTFQASTKCNNVNSVWSYVYQLLVDCTVAAYE